MTEESCAMAINFVFFEPYLKNVCGFGADVTIMEGPHGMYG